MKQLLDYKKLDQLDKGEQLINTYLCGEIADNMIKLIDLKRDYIITNFLINNIKPLK